MYLVFAVALVVGLMPLTGAVALAQPCDVTLLPQDYSGTPGSAVQVWGAPITVSTSGMAGAACTAYGANGADSWSVTAQNDAGATVGFTPDNAQVVGGEYACDFTPDVRSGYIDAEICFEYYDPALSANVTICNQYEWHEDCDMYLEPCGRSTEVIWNEQQKELSGGPEYIKLVDIACDLGQELRGNGAIVHWFMVTGPTDCVSWTGDQNASNSVVTTLAQLDSADILDPDPDPCSNQDEVYADLLQLLGIGVNDPVHYIQSVTAQNADIDFQDPDGTCTLGNGTSYVSLNADCEGVSRVVAVVEYPRDFSCEDWKIDRASLNWWTQPNAKVPQVRWAGEKIVLEKCFGSEYAGEPVCFSLEDQSVGTLEVLSPEITPPVPAYPVQTQDTIWTQTDANGTARCILISEDPGQADIDLALYSQDPATSAWILENEHGFVVYFLKFESITLSEVLGERVDNPITIDDAGTCAVEDPVEGHDSGLMDVGPTGAFGLEMQPWDPNPQETGTATGASDLTLTEGGKTWTVDEWAEYYVAITSGPGRGLVRKIVSNTIDTLTVDGCWTLPGGFGSDPAAGSTYQIGGDLLPAVDLSLGSPQTAADYDQTTTEVLNVSQDALLRVRVEGFFENSNPSMKNIGWPMTSKIQVGWMDANRNAGPDMPNPDGYDYALPQGRWILPEDWPYLAGVDWEAQRLYWDIMDNPFDVIMSCPDGLIEWTRNACAPPSPFGLFNTDIPDGREQLGGYWIWDIDPATGKQATQVPGDPSDPCYGGFDITDPTNPLVAQFPVIGPVSTLDNYTPFLNAGPMVNIPPTSYPGFTNRKTIVRNAELDKWDTPMPPAKIEFVIYSGAGYFKEADKGDVYYGFVDTEWSPTDDDVDAMVYTNPFYAVEIPASPEIPPFLNNSEYDWDSWGFVGMPQGPYDFWTVFNRWDCETNPQCGYTDEAEMPRRVSVFTDNHGEAMVWLNGLSARETLLAETALTTLTGEIDAPVEMRIGNTTIYAYADYPYLTGKHPKVKSNTIEKELTWGKHVLGMNPQTFGDYGGYTYPWDDPAAPIPMLFQIGTIAGNGLSEYKLAFIWVSDADGNPPIGERVQWNFSTLGDQAEFATGFSPGAPCSSAGHPSSVVNGFLEGTYIGIDPWYEGGRQYAISQLIAPTDAEKLLFAKWLDDYAPPGAWPACLDVDDFACAAMAIYEQGPQGETYQLTAELDEGPIVGTITREISVRFDFPDALDDPRRDGDADLNAFVNMGDVTAVERIVLGMAPMNANADANRSGSVDMGDVTKIERMILGR